jgi:glutamate synthase domain-containing protein 1
MLGKTQEVRAMCGIVGLYVKNPKLKSKLGRIFKPMIIEMTNRGPDSAGVAIYRNPVKKNETKFSLAHNDPAFDWKKIDVGLERALKCDCKISKIGNHCILVTNAKEKAVTDWLRKHFPEVRVVGSGHTIEIFKETGLPANVYEKFNLDEAQGTHIIGHTRMATESAVTTAGSHPFATGADLCLVHNGSLSNHNRLRENLRREGMEFQTENDTEVAAAYMTWKLRQGATLKETLQDALKDLDGFYTFLVGTHDGFAVVRDPIACKHAVIAENDDYVAMATEYRAIAHLPGADKAKIWEPEPVKIYTWGGSEGGHA